MNLIIIKNVFRSLFKHKWQSIPSILALAIGMASFISIFFYIGYEKSYDKMWNSSELVYRIALEKTLSNGNITRSATNYPGLCRILEDEVPEIESATGLWGDKVTVYTPLSFIQDGKLYWSDVGFFNVFDVEFIVGSSKKNLSNHTFCRNFRIGSYQFIWQKRSAT